MMVTTLDPKNASKTGTTKSGKAVVLALLAAIFGLFAVVVVIGMTGGSQHVPGAAPGIGFVKADVGTKDDDHPPSPSASASAGAASSGAIQKTVIDKKVRDELRKRILEGWAASAEPEVSAAAKQGRLVPAPKGPDGGAMDPKYIQEVVRSELFPMAQKCYEELLSRKDAAAGRVLMKFTIAADAKLGGLVEDAEVEADGGVADEKMATCVRESLSTISFRPPAHGGVVTVEYPIVFSPGDEKKP